jgi:transposase
MYYAGIDWADNHHDIVVIDEANQKQVSLRVAHSVSGMAVLDKFLKSLVTDSEQMACIIETNQGLLITALLEAGWPVYPVNPKTVDGKRGAAGAKTDKLDAYLLAKTGRSDLADLRRLKPDSPNVQELRELSRDQDNLVEMQSRLVNQITACLKIYYPVALELFSKVQQLSSLLFLQTYPTPKQAQVATPKEIEELWAKAGHTRAVKVAPQIYQKLQ